MGLSRLREKSSEYWDATEGGEEAYFLYVDRVDRRPFNQPDEADGRFSPSLLGF